MIASERDSPCCPPDPSTAVIEARGLTRYFGTRCAVDSVSFQVPRGSVFGLGTAQGFGVVRAKTGNLSTAAALAGTVYAKNGQVLGFAIMADRISNAPGALGAAATAMVNVAGALAGCGCR